MKPEEPQHVAFVASCAYPARSGNQVGALIDGAPAFQRICAAIAAARHSVYATVAFIHADFAMPGGAGSFFDVMDRASRRGLDVRALFWRSNPEDGIDHGTHFSGLPAHHAMLRDRGSTFGIRWDRAKHATCHHQKSWIVDAGHPGEIAFVGGINLNPRSLGMPGHRDDANGLHDVYAEIAGPSATDVHHNFAERWNQASEREASDGHWGAKGREDIGIPARISAPRGDSVVQIQRTMLKTGETSIFTQYVQAIEAAKRTIYIENQALEHPGIVARLHAALRRGVVVVALVPVDVEAAVRHTRRLSKARPFFEELAALGEHEDFTMAGLSVQGRDGTRRNVYVHSKVMLVDDAFATIGSCNIRSRSFFEHTELNASVYDPTWVRKIRSALFSEHLDAGTSGLGDVAAHRLFAKVARNNSRSPSDGWRGIAFAFEPSDYAA